MPLVQINMLCGRTPEQKEALLRAVTDAVHTSIGASLPSIRVWINEFERHEYMAGGEFAAPAAAIPAAGSDAQSAT